MGVTAGVLNLHRIEIPNSAGLTFASIVAAVAVVATGAPVNAFIGVYRSNGLLVAQSANQVTNWSTTGYKTIAAPGSVPAGDVFCWVGLVVDAFTAPYSFAGNGAGIAVGWNDGLAASFLLHGEYSSGLSALPASIVPANIVQPASQRIPFLALA